MREVKKTLGEIFQRQGLSLKRVRFVTGGANSRLARIWDSRGRDWIAKIYRCQSGDPRDRLGTEVKSFSFLMSHRVHCVPRPFCMDRKNGIAVFEHVAGRRLGQKEIDRRVLDEVLVFFGKLRDLSSSAGAAAFSDASEACFSLSAYRRNLVVRKRRLEHSAVPSLRRFMKGPVRSVALLLEERVLTQGRRNGIRQTRILPKMLRRLSPSDVGFHNILRRDRSGELVFLDFEYFGWDDPAKTLSDIILQPDRPLPPQWVPYFADKFIGLYPDDAELKSRFALVAPLLWMKWIFIMLNCFLSGPRNFSGPAGAKTRRAQLGRAECRLVALEAALRTGQIEAWLSKGGVQATDAQP